ncbi:MAG: hypothetical protein ACOZCO_11320 [Bacteroidota bacterium]
MKKTEKRFFKLYFSKTLFSLKRRNNSKQFIRLFDILESQKEYNETDSEKKLRTSFSVKQIHPVRNYLYNSLLDCMVITGQENSSGTSIRKLIDQAEFLFKKGLYIQSYELIEKANAGAVRFEEWEAQLWIRHWKMRIVTRPEVFRLIDHSPVYDKESKKLLTNLSILHKLENLRQSMINKTLEKGLSFYDTPFAMNSELEAILDAAEEKPENFRIRKVVLHIRASWFATKKDFVSAEKEFENIVKLLEEHPHFIENDPQEYFRILRNFIGYKAFNEKHEDVLEMVKKLRVSPVRTISGKEIKYPADDQFFLNNTEAYALTKSGLFTEAYAFVNKWISQEKRWEKNLNEENRTLLTYNLAYISFSLGKQAEALKWTNKIIRSRFATVRQDIDIAARLLNLIIHFELKNYDFLPYAVRSTSRYIKKKEHLYQSEILMIDFFKKVPVLYTENRLKESILKLRSDLEDMKKTAEGKEDAEYFDYLIPWLDSKIKNKPYSKIVREQYLSQKGYEN